MFFLINDYVFERFWIHDWMLCIWWWIMSTWLNVLCVCKFKFCLSFSILITLLVATIWGEDDVNWSLLYYITLVLIWDNCASTCHFVGMEKSLVVCFRNKILPKFPQTFLKFFLVDSCTTTKLSHIFTSMLLKVNYEKVTHNEIWVIWNI